MVMTDERDLFFPFLFPRIYTSIVITGEKVEGRTSDFLRRKAHGSAGQLL